MNEVTRSMEATGATAAARVAQMRRTQPNGWWGVLLLIATEATLFGTLIATYFYLRFRTVPWPPAGIKPPDVLAPSLLTGILVATSVPMWLAVRAARVGQPRTAWWLIVLALIVQAGYLGGQIHLFTDDWSKFGGQTAYGSIYFTMLGIHHAHVLIGIALDLWLAGRLLGGLTNYRVIAVRATAAYWYFVNALAVCVLLTQLTPSI